MMARPMMASVTGCLQRSAARSRHVWPGLDAINEIIRPPSRWDSIPFG